MCGKLKIYTVNSKLIHVALKFWKDLELAVAGDVDGENYSPGDEIADDGRRVSSDVTILSVARLGLAIFDAGGQNGKMLRVLRHRRVLRSRDRQVSSSMHWTTGGGERKRDGGERERKRKETRLLEEREKKKREKERWRRERKERN